MFLSLDAVVAHIGLCLFHYSSSTHAGDIKYRETEVHLSGYEQSCMDDNTDNSLLTDTLK